MGDFSAEGAWALFPSLFRGEPHTLRPSQRGRSVPDAGPDPPAEEPPVPDVPVPSPQVGLLYDARMRKHRSPHGVHPEDPERITRIFRRLEEGGIAARCVRVPCREAAREELELKHTARHVDAMLLLGGMSEEEALRQSDLYNSVFLCPGSTQSALLSAGSVLEAVRRVGVGDVESAICVVRPPGHHAEHDCAMGFCLFGNVALAAAEARKQGWSARTLIVDWDVHHGNGTQRMFEEDCTVLYFSTHRHDGGAFYPGGMYGHYTSHGTGSGAGYSVNVPWDVRGEKRRGGRPPGDAEFLLAFTEVLLPIAADFQPDLVLVSAGFDSAEGDPLGGCKVTPRGFYELTRLLLGLAGGRLVLALEGGYNLESISASTVACAHAMLGDPAPANPEGCQPLCGDAPSDAPSDAPQPSYAALVDEVRTHFAQFWPALNVPEGRALVHGAQGAAAPAS
mmetsp:Transcript_64517/g.181523  ORF Transcript_64517/g.181523 Transcript_64517/m.181523 type:complete len:451 (-) Transcript_64517:64-1416(-)